MEFAQTQIASALIGAGVAPTGADAPAPLTLVKASQPERIKPLAYSEAQAFAFWTARKAEEKGSACWSAVAPIMSAYLVNGGSANSIRNKGQGISPFAAHIWANKTRKDRAAQMAFMECAKLSAGSCKYSQADHDDSMGALELAFYQVLNPNAAAKPRKAQETRYTVAQLCEALQAGQLGAEDVAALRKALPSNVREVEEQT